MGSDILTGKTRWGEKILYVFFLSCGMATMLTTVGVVFVLIFETFHFFREVPVLDFVTDTEWSPLFMEKHFGIWPLLSGTFLTTAVALLVAFPVGLPISIYLSEYASERSRKSVMPILEVLAGIPTVVFGYFALLFVTPLLQEVIPGLKAFNALAPGIVIGFMILPMITSISGISLQSVPDSLRQAAFALGSTKLQVALKVVMPAAISGITASVVLAASRAIGETMIVSIAAGQQASLSFSPLEPVQTMTAYIVQVSLGDTPADSLESRTIYAVGMMLFLATFSVNIFNFYLKQKIREANS